MENQKEDFRHIILSYFQKGENAYKTASKTCTVYGQYTVSDDTVQRYFEKLKCINSSAKDGVALDDHHL